MMTLLISKTLADDRRLMRRTPFTPMLVVTAVTARRRRRRHSWRISHCCRLRRRRLCWNYRPTFCFVSDHVIGALILFFDVFVSTNV